MPTPNEPNENETSLRQVIAFIGILLIILGQFSIFLPLVNNDQLPPNTFILSIVGFLLFVSSYFVKLKPSQKDKSHPMRIPSKIKWIIIAITFSVLTTFSMLLFIKNNQPSFIPVLTTWFASGIFYIFAFREGLPDNKQIIAWFKNHYIELIILSGIILLGLVIRFYNLGNLPRIIDGDEGVLGLFAQSTTSGHYANPFALWENFGAVYLQAVNVAIWFFGNNAFALRILPAISGTLAIPALYLLARQITGKRVAFVAAFLLAVSHTHINFSRIGSVGYIHSTWLVPLELYLLFAGFAKRKSWMAAAGGVLLAFHFSIYLTSQIVTGLVLVYFIILLIFYKKWFLPIIRQTAAFLGGLAIMALPEFIYAIQNQGQFLDRLNKDGLFQSGWLTQTMASTGHGAIEVLAGRVAHAFLSLIYYPAFDFYGSNLPVLTLFASVFFLAGLGIALLRIRNPGILLINGYFWALTLAVGIFSIPPSADSYRMLMVLPPAFIFVAMAIDEVLTLMGIGWVKNRNVYAFITSGFLISLALFNLWAYFGDFVGQCRYGGDLQSRFASYLGSFTNSTEQGSNIFLLSDSIYLNGTHGSTAYLNNNRPITNVNDPIDSWTGVKGDTIIASPNRITELDTWILAHPGGETDFVYDCKLLILKAYRLP